MVLENGADPLFVERRILHGQSSEVDAMLVYATVGHGVVKLCHVSRMIRAGTLGGDVRAE